jgi:sterol desaturase/sphingolipid hydroxylase (fatty acid hydroxylase superfamily)
MQIDDSSLGRRDKRGDWHPFEPASYPVVFVMPPQPLGILKWLFAPGGYLLSWNLVYALVAAAVWYLCMPPLAKMATFSTGWIASILLTNAGLLVLMFGGMHLWLYIRKSQGTAYKFNGRWPAEGNDAFLFNRQTTDNLTWVFASALPIWTAYEVLTMWAFANGYIPYLDPAAHPIAFVAILLLVPMFRDIHFYCVHRLIHWPPLYRTVHKYHHANVNPAPWSGLAMHPVEHLLYFSSVLIHWIVPSHPFHALYNLIHLGLSPAPGHTGFDRVLIAPGRGASTAIETHSYAHYLHHKYFECNYADGAIPLDRWFGSFHDGSEQSLVTMNARLAKRAAKPAAPRGT